jgi:DNA-binding NtrC family response regulator
VSTVLLVQPDIELHDQWAAALSRNGHEVLSVHTVEDGVARAREGGIDVVVLDASDESSGTGGSVRLLVAELERLPDAPPMVLVSESPQAPELSAQVGAAGFLPKPCSCEDLVEVVARVASASVRVHTFDEETTSPRRKY